ncbi:hypothetical protein IM793_12740 [Pedobacter sp. MR2016-19]|uniref:hypothetical protein n=1 Tax=Pedobacter sp. MR2016-19 TaxID=2780089 RepID=UPI001876C50F|nr:hypothetical protein [Pedobacter sp. MR2016-19]MBE5320032.1 hypothetical protein [Pedobacter sp. MR2016-19]
MFKNIKIAIINSSEKELLDTIEDGNKEENSLWKVPNLIVPFATILLAIICFVSFSNDRANIISYFNLIINGSLPLIAINQISSTGTHLFKYNKEQEKRFGNNTFMLRTKLFWYSLAVLVLGVILFAVQVINNPFSNWVALAVLIIISSSLIFASSYISRRLFLLQENFLDKTFDKVMNDETKENKKHLSEKYGE